MIKINKVENLKKCIITLIQQILCFTLIESELEHLLNKCHVLNNYLQNNFFDNILYDTQLKIQDKYDEFYIYENLNQIKEFIKAQ